MKLKLYNSLTRKLEEFKPINPPMVGVYTCGPTVYDYVTIGNWRTYVLGDLLVRTLKYLGYNVSYIMNITDVGHLTGDNLGDADIGEDRMEKGARREGKTAWDIAEFYTKDFWGGYKKLNLTLPKKFTKATEHIKEQIALVKKIEEKGFAYKTTDGVYFDVGLYEKAGNKYGELSTLEKIKEGVRVEPNPEKRDPRDFALWKFSYPPGRSFDAAQDDAALRRQMEWESPWGKGFPGWHIECSAMGMKYLGEQFDIHVGGEDLRSTHHPNEIAQSEAATGKKPFVKYWLHGAFLLVDGGRMGKSLGNAYTLHDIEDHGFKPEHLRYFYLTGHYRKQLNFTWEALEKAKQSYERLWGYIRLIKDTMRKHGAVERKEKTDFGREFTNNFKKALGNDLNMPGALVVLRKMLHSTLSLNEKLKLVREWERVLGLNLLQAASTKRQVPDEIKKLIDKREKLRREKRWEEADRIRQTIEAKGFIVKDTKKGAAVIAK